MMDPSYSFPQDDYALTILTPAAMRTHQTSDSSSLSGTSLTSARGIAQAITNRQNDDLVIDQRAPSVSSHPRSEHILAEYNPAALSTRSMDTLTFNQTAAGRQVPYMSQGFHGIGAQISQNYANSLAILNAESYDDGRGALRSREASEMRTRQSEPTLAFGITSGPKITLDRGLRTDSEEADAGSRRRKKPRIEAHQSGDDDEEATKKARGRPRVDTKDETAADRRRTQIRMAQRAYRHRKETTISSLETRVQHLKGANEEMSNIFISLYDFAVGKGLLDREPAFGRQLQSATERFLALAKTAEDHEDTNGDDGEKHDDGGESGSRKTKSRRASPKKRQEATPPVSEPVHAWGGYSLSKDDSPEIDMNYQPDQQYRTRDDLQIITRPTEDNASFPFELMDLQQYRVEVPEIEDYSQNFFPQPQLPLPNSHSYHESSFARRIDRGAIEKALRLITTTVDESNERFRQIFGFCLLYESKEAIETRMKRQLASSIKDTLQNWRAPFVHVGGAGTYYPIHDSDVNEDLMPKFRTGYSMGPFSSPVSQAQEVLDENMNCILPGFEGEFFDANDVEGYLRGRGLDIPPAADFVTGEVDLLALTEMPSPKSHTSDTVTSIMSPRTPESPTGSLPLDGDNFELGKSGGTMAISKTLGEMTSTLPYPLQPSSNYDGWDSDSLKDNSSFIDPIFSMMPHQSSARAKTPELIITDSRYGEKRTVTVNVKTLLDEIIRRGVCLGRAPGFRPADVNAAIIAAVKAGF